MNNRTLLIVFLLLLAVFGISQLFTGKRTKSFNSELIKVDTAAITSIVVNPKAPEEAEITLKKEDTGWIASNGTISVKAQPGSVSNLLSNLTLIKTKRIAAKSPEKWAEYEVEEGKATRIRVYAGAKLLEDFIVGRFSFNQQAQTGSSFIRLTAENEVYAVDGFQTLTFGQGFGAYRDKVLAKVAPPMKVTQFSQIGPDTTYNYFLADGQWTYEGQTILDSMKVETYLNTFKNFSGQEFNDSFDEIQANNFPSRSLTIKGDNILEPLVITCYTDTTQVKPYTIHSNYNEAYFLSDSAGIYSKLFRSVNDFVAEN